MTQSMSAIPFLSLLLVLSSLLSLLMNSWVMLWVMLELNTMAFCSLLKNFTKKKSGEAEASMKYLIIQSIASVLLVFTILSAKLTPVMMMMLITMGALALMIKVAASPFHQWFIKIVKKILWKPSTTLMTWQKLTPVYLMLYQTKKLLLPFIILSCLVGVTSQMNKTMCMEIMGFSSIFNLSWMMFSLLMNFWLFLVFCLMYWMTVIMAMYTLEKTKIKKMQNENNKMTSKWSFMMVMINLGGIPPMLGFLSKWIAFSEILKHYLIALVTFLLMISSVNLYVYLRLINSQMMKVSPKTPKVNSNVSKGQTMMITGMNSLPLLILVF